MVGEYLLQFEFELVISELALVSIENILYCLLELLIEPKMRNSARFY